MPAQRLSLPARGYPTDMDNMDNMSDRPQEKGLADEETEAAAAEAAEIGGRVPVDDDDPAMQPLAEAGGGVAEGFELAEKDLENNAGHGDQRGFPESAVPPPEEPQTAEYGEPDEESKEDA